MPFESDIVLVPKTFGDIAEVVVDQLMARVRDEYPEVARRSRLGLYMNDDQATQETGLTKRQLRHLRAENKIEFVKRGRIILYDTASLLAYLDKGRIRTRGE